MASTNQGNQGNQSNQGGSKDPSANKDQNTDKAQNVGKDLPGSSNRGSAAMDPNQQREMANKGGKPAQESGTAHELTAEEAREAARKSGQSGSGLGSSSDKR
jgi:general stress protein YciG